MDVNYNDALQGDIQGQALEVYDETARRMEAAVAAFRSYYSSMNPLPIEPNYPAMPNLAEKPQIARFLGLKQIGMVLGLLGSVILSASHTIPVFMGKASALEINLLSFEGLVAISVFVMIEVGLVTFAYSKIEGSPNSETAKQVQELTGWGLKFILAIAVLANVYYVLSGNTTIPTEGFFASAWYWTRVIIFLLIGASAPLVALITGDILAMDVLRHKATIKRDNQAWEDKKALDMQTWENKVDAIKARYQDELAKWNAGLNNAWQASKAKWGGSVNIQISKPEIKQLETVSNSSKQLDYTQSLTQKAALQYIQDKADEYKAIAKTVREQNPTANQRDIAEAISRAMTGEERGYMTVIRAYKKLGIEME